LFQKCSKIESERVKKLPPFSSKIIKEHINKEAQEQIAGFDLTVRKIFEIGNDGSLDFDNSKRNIPEHKEISLREDFWELEPGGYLAQYNEIVEVPLNAIGLVFPRSSLMRCGGTLCSAVWDPGYKGRGVGLLIVYTKMKLYKNARIAQIIFLKTEKHFRNIQIMRLYTEN